MRHRRTTANMTTDDTTAEDTSAEDFTADDETPDDENGDTAMSLDTTGPDSGTQPASTEPVYERDATVDPVTGQPTDANTETGTYATDDAETGTYGTDTDTYAGTDVDTDRPQPTFTPADETSMDDGTGVRTDPGFADADATGLLPAVTPLDDEPVATTPAAPADGPQTTSTTAGPVTSVPADEPVAALSGDEPLLANTAGMQASWQAVQAGFVDNPQAAVSEAADLIEQTAQSLIDALQQRQRQLRVPADGGSLNGTTNGVGDPAAPGYATSSSLPDTEQLRLMMQRYRSLFNTLSNA